MAKDTEAVAKDLAIGAAVGIGALSLGAYELVRGVGGLFRRKPNAKGEIIEEEVKVDEIKDTKYYGPDGEVYAATKKSKPRKL